MDSKITIVKSKDRDDDIKIVFETPENLYVQLEWRKIGPFLLIWIETTKLTLPGRTISPI